MGNKTVFLSYAREDKNHAERLYKDLRCAEIDAWIDSKCLLPGQRWKREITEIIRNSAFFIALLSKHSTSKRGYVQKEIRIALDVLQEVPANQIFFIPARLEECKPADLELRDLNWVDLFPSYEKGVRRILSVLREAGVDDEPLRFLDPTKPEGPRLRLTKKQSGAQSVLFF